MALSGKIPVDGFKDKEQIRDWLKQQSLDVVVVMAARSALRVWPLLSHGLSTKDFATTTTVIVLPCFRAMIASLSAGSWEDSVALRLAVRSAAAATAATAGAGAAAAYAASIYVARSFVRSVAAAADAAYAARSAAAYAAFTADADAIENGQVSASGLAASALWGAGIDDMPPELKQAWRRQEQQLLALDENWQVWTNWYAARLRGDPMAKDRELAFVTELDDDDWNNDPAEINAKLQKILDRFDIELPQQDPNAETFDFNEQGKISVSTQKYGQALTDSDSQRIWYDEYRTAIAILSAESPNMLGSAFVPARSLMQGLPENINDARVASVWARSNSLRSIFARHKVAMADSDPNPDKLNPAIAGGIEHALGVFHNLTSGDPALLDAEQISIGPQEEEQLQQLSELIQPVIADAIEQGLTDVDASELLGEIKQHLQIHPIDVPTRLQRMQDHKVQRNFTGVLLGGLQKIRDGGLFVGKVELGTFLSRHVRTIFSYVKEVWPNLITRVTELFSGL